MTRGSFGAAPTAEVLAIGDELTHGLAVDTNSAHIARVLEEAGFEVRRLTVVSDEPAALQDAIRSACARAAVVVATGGLGPTEDDRTREVAAAAAGVELCFDDASWRHIEAMFARRRSPLPARNRQQAFLPAGALVLRNDWGTAPGFALTIGGALFASLPGVPREMVEMLAARVLPLLRERFGLPGAFAFLELRVLGLAEAELGARIADEMAAGRNPRVGITAHSGLLTIRIAAYAATAAAAQALCARDAASIRPRVGEFLVYEGNEAIEARAARALLESRTTVALAESCTAGEVAAALTAFPGVSAVFLAGFVTYADAAKVRDLDVAPELLAEHGAVSIEVAAAMAEGAARRAGARLGVSITGIAGPAGGTADKPAGTVCFALCLDGKTTAWRRRFPDLGRAFVRARAVMEALAAIVRLLEVRGADAVIA